jgi:hypothetical protein
MTIPTPQQAPIHPLRAIHILRTAIQGMATLFGKSEVGQQALDLTESVQQAPGPIPAAFAWTTFKANDRTLILDGKGAVIGGSVWPSDCAAIVNAHNADLRATLAAAVPGKEPVAWVRRHPDGALTAEYLEDGVIEPVRRKSGAWLPMYLGAAPVGEVVAAPPEPKLVLALPDYETRRIVIASDEVIDGERLVCVAIKGGEAVSATDLNRNAEATEDFASWLAREMPPGTVIASPAWWAPRILSYARIALRAAGVSLLVRPRDDLAMMRGLLSGVQGVISDLPRSEERTRLIGLHKLLEEVVAALPPQAPTTSTGEAK